MSEDKVNDGTIVQHNPAGLGQRNEILLGFPCLGGIDDVEDVVAVPCPCAPKCWYRTKVCNFCQALSWWIFPSWTGCFVGNVEAVLDCANVRKEKEV